MSPALAPTPEENRIAADAPLILCVDDDATVEALVRSAAQRAGVRLGFYESPEAFKRALESEPVAGVIVDQVMPESTGTEIIMWMRTLASKPPVLLIGADELYLKSAALLARSAGLALRCTLQKPFDVKKMAEAIARLIERA